MKKILVIVLILAVSFMAFAGGQSEDGTQADKIVIRFASSFEPGHTTCQAGDLFKEIVESRSNSRIEVQTFWGGSMGSEEELCESVSTGGIEMQVGGGIPIKVYAPKYQFMNDPFVMKSWDHWKRVWDGGVGEDLKNQILTKGNTKYLDVMYLGVRHFTSNKPIRTPKDVENLKLRLPNLPTWVRVWKEVGALPVPIALNELFSALQMGVADASEGMLSQVYSFNLNEVQDYLSLTGHGIQSGAITINNDFFESLSAEDQTLIIEAGQEACAWATKQTIEGDEELLEKLKAKGMKVVEADQEAFLEAARPAVEALFKEVYPVTTWEEVLSY